MSEPWRVACILSSEGYKPGDPHPEGYLAEVEWADVQLKAGLRQRVCGRCGKWKFPQELSDLIDISKLRSVIGTITVRHAVCNKCVSKP